MNATETDKYFDDMRRGFDQATAALEVEYAQLQDNPFDAPRFAIQGGKTREQRAAEDVEIAKSRVLCDTLNRQDWANEVEANALALANDRIKAALGAGVAGPADVPSFDRFRVVEAIEFADGDFEEPEWQVHELVPKQGSGLDTGESKTWKSFKIFDLAAAIHRGVPYRGRPVRKGRSVIVVAEGISGYPLRMRAYAEHHGVALTELPAIIPAAPNLFEPKQITALIGQLKILGATYVALDTKWRCSVGAEENSAKDNAIVFGSIERIAREVGCFCTAISHTGKDPTKGVRGSSSQFAAVDVEVTHERAGDYGTSTVTKLKDAQDGAIFTVKMLPVELGVSSRTGLPYGSLVVDHVDDAPRVKGSKLPVHGSLLRTALDTVRALIVKEAGAVTLKAARDAIAETKSEPEPGEKDRRGGRAGGEIDTLVRQQLLFRDANGMIFDTQVVKGKSDENF